MSVPSEFNFLILLEDNHEEIIRQKYTKRRRDGEVLHAEQEKIFGKSNAKKNEIGSTAMNAAQTFYYSPLYGGSLNIGKNIREMRSRYEDWLRTDGQKSE